MVDYEWIVIPDEDGEEHLHLLNFKTLETMIEIDKIDEEED